MAKEGYYPQEEIYFRKDPVTGMLVEVMRERYNHIRSPKLGAFDACVHQNLEGTQFRGHGAKEDSILVRQNFTRIAHLCSSKVDREFKD